MKKIMLIVVLLIFLIALVIGIFYFSKNSSTVVESGDIISSGDIENDDLDEVFVPVDKTEGNGTSFVSYKGNIYYIELLNDDYEDYTKSYDFAKEQSTSNTQRRMNIIHPNGKVENLFNISGATEFSIYDDRIYYVKSNGMLHSVDMKGEDDKELARGKFVCFDTDNHKVYYTLSNDKSRIFKMDMKTLEVSSENYSNTYDDDSYVFLGYRDNCLYYYKIDSTYDNIMFVQHDLVENKDFNIITKKIEKTRDEKSYATEYGRYINRLNATDDDLKYISVGYLDGSGMFFSYGKLYEFSIGSGDVELITNELEDERVNVINDKLYYVNGNMESSNIIEYDIHDKSKVILNYDDSILGSKALIYFDGVYSIIKQPYSEELLKIARGYGLYESAFRTYYSGDLVDTYPYISGYNEYEIFVSDVRVVGRNIFYTINIARLDPTKEEHSRGTIVPVYVRRATETYLYNMDSKNNTLVYAINNGNNFIKEIKVIESQIDKDVNAAKEEKEYEKKPDEPVDMDIKPQDKDEEKYIEIDPSTSIWQNEFDIRVEQTGGTIMNKYIAYEGHHSKSEGKLKIKIKNVHNSRLVIYVDGVVFSDTVVD